MFKVQAQYESVIKAQGDHIVRLERMVSELFNTLLYITKKDAMINLGPKVDIEPSDIVGPTGDPEPDPGEIYGPSQL